MDELDKDSATRVDGLPPQSIGKHGHFYSGTAKAQRRRYRRTASHLKDHHAVVIMRLHRNTFCISCGFHMGMGRFSRFCGPDLQLEH
jgi:hypothetical protein